MSGKRQKLDAASQIPGFANPSPEHGHGHGHGHKQGQAAGLELGRPSRIFLLSCLFLGFLLTVAGVWTFYPDGETPTADFAAPGVIFTTGEVVAVEDACSPSVDGSEPLQVACGTVTVSIDGGPEKGQERDIEVPQTVIASGVRAGDGVDLMRVPGGGGVKPSYSFFGLDRAAPIGWLTLIFVLIVGAIARLRGILAILGLAFAGVVVWKFMLPALLQGASGVGVALAGSALIMFVVLYLAHGVSWRTSTALLGTLLGIGITTAIGAYGMSAGRLSGAGEEEAGLLGAQVALDFRGLFLSTVIIASLGVLNDVTITQASSIWELRAAAPTMSRLALFQSGMRIGRDHIASTIYTIVFAYSGASLTTLLLVSLFDRSLLGMLNSENIAAEVFRTLSGAIGLVLAVPITTALGALVVGGSKEPVAAH